MRQLKPKESFISRRAKMFVPDYMVKTVFDIDFRKLKALGITAVAFDVDSTLVPHGKHDFDENVLKFLDKHRNQGSIERFALASNRSKNGIEKLAKDHNFYLVHATPGKRKPSRRYYKYLSETLDTNPKQTAMVGDKLLQDIYGANRAGMVSILVEPVGEEAWYDALLLRRFRQKKKLRRIARESS